MCVCFFFFFFFFGGGGGAVVAFSINNNVNKSCCFYRYDSDKPTYPRYIEICTFLRKISGADPGFLEVGSDV